jgi:hypothetical protein
MFHRNGPRLALVFLLAGASCQTTQPERVLRLPGAATPVRVTTVVERGLYLDATLLGENLDLQFFFPTTPTCRRVLFPGADVEYTKGAVLGHVRSADGTCEPVGIASLRAWRDRRPRARVRGVPRSQAVFKLVYRDEDVALVRGRFPLTGHIGWSGGSDTIAVIPIQPACSKILERGLGSMEFRSKGREPYVLIGPEEDCPILGFVRP